MKTPLVLGLLLLAYATFASAGDDGVDQSSLWKVSHTFVKRARKKKEATGIVLYTAEPDTLDTAFRCQKGRLYAFVAVKPVSMHEAMVNLGWQVKRWRLKVAIGDGEFRDEIWASVHDGRILMARKRTTSLAIFAAARKGTSIHIDPKYGKDVTIDIPADDSGAFRHFEELCGFVAPGPNSRITTA